MVNIFPIVGKLYLVMDEPTAHHMEGFRSLKSGPYRKKNPFQSIINIYEEQLHDDDLTPRQATIQRSKPIM